MGGHERGLGAIAPVDELFAGAWGEESGSNTFLDNPDAPFVRRLRDFA